MGQRVALPKNGLVRERPLALAGRILGHRSWSAEVTARFQQQHGRTRRHAQDFTYAGAQRWFARSQRWQKVTAVRQQIDLHLTLNNAVYQKNVFASAQAAPDARSNGHPQTLFGRGTAVATIPGWYPVEKSSLRTTPPQPGPSTAVMVPQFSIGPHRTLPAVVSFRRLQFSEPDKSQDVTVVETVYTQLGARIQRKLQRVEVRPSYQAVEISERPSGTSPRGDLFVQSSTAGSILRNAARSSFDDPPGPPPAPVLNMGEITNEVIRQLDHRLVAIRERMGKM
jgi:hypothetical protein